MTISLNATPETDRGSLEQGGTTHMSNDTIQFKHYARDAPNYPTPSHTPTSTKNEQSENEHENYIENDENKSPKSTKVSKDITSKAPRDFTPKEFNTKDSNSNNVDENGYPFLSREFVVRRISEGETGRLKEELKCEACGKGYKHITSLAKHLWEHTAEWQSTKRLLISKHQQAQLLEAASILCSFNENDNNNNNTNANNNNNNNNTNAVANGTTTAPNNYLNNTHASLTARRKSRSDGPSKTGKFGGKRRTTSINHSNRRFSEVEFLRRGSTSILPPSDIRARSGSIVEGDSVLYDSEDE